MAHCYGRVWAEKKKEYYKLVVDLSSFSPCDGSVPQQFFLIFSIRSFRVRYNTAGVGVVFCCSTTPLQGVAAGRQHVLLLLEWIRSLH